MRGVGDGGEHERMGGGKGVAVDRKREDQMKIKKIGRSSAGEY